jgi:hypothetical protein
MIAAILPLLARYWKPLALVALLTGLVIYHKGTVAYAHHEGVVAGRAEIQAKLDEAQARSTALALLWAQGLEKQDAAVRKQKEADDAKFAELQAQTSALSDRLVVVSGALDRVLRDASRAANAARLAVGGDESAPSVPASTGNVAYAERAIGQFVTEAAQAYAEAWRKWHACVSTYQSLQHEAAP